MGVGVDTVTEGEIREAIGSIRHVDLGRIGGGCVQLSIPSHAEFNYDKMVQISKALGTTKIDIGAEDFGGCDTCGGEVEVTLTIYMEVT